LRVLEIQRLLDGFTEEENRAKISVKMDLMKSWKQSLDVKKQTPPESASYRPADLSLPPLTGEDVYHDERVKAQQNQMKRWVQEHVDLKVHQRMVEKSQDDKYEEMMRAILDIREAAEREENDMRKYMSLSVKEQNDELAKIQREQRRKENFIFDGMNREAVLASTTLTIPDDRALATDDSGRIVRRDMFRGYSEEQRQRILLDNENIRNQKRYDICWS
jgi:RIB43A